jgi:hypothetical protein
MKATFDAIDRAGSGLDVLAGADVRHLQCNPDKLLLTFGVNMSYPKGRARERRK